MSALVNSAYVDEFVFRFEQLSGKAYRAPSRSEALEIIGRLVKERGQQGQTLCTVQVLDALETDAASIYSTLYNVPKDADALQVLKLADVAITTADYGIAETGCLVELAYAESTRLLSSLSRVHIALLNSKDMLGKLSELAPILRKAFSKGDAPSVSLISGPSRTSDIEMKSVLGVHGPHEVHAVLLM